MKRDYKLYIDDIRESLNFIEKYVSNVSEEEFMKDILLQDAIARRLEIIGEATKNIPKALKDKNKHVPWPEMSHIRDLIAHEYYEVSLNRIWLTIKKRIPLIKKSMAKIALV